MSSHIVVKVFIVTCLYSRGSPWDFFSSTTYREGPSSNTWDQNWYCEYSWCDKRPALYKCEAHPPTIYLSTGQEWWWILGVLWIFALLHDFELQNNTFINFGLWELSITCVKYYDAVWKDDVPTLLCPLWAWNPITVTAFSIFSNKSLGECVDVNLIFLCDTSCNGSSHQKSEIANLIGAANIQCGALMVGSRGQCWVGIFKLNLQEVINKKYSGLTECWNKYWKVRWW